MQYKDYYLILGVSEQATNEEIRKAYIKLAREYHPDKQYGNGDWKEINEEFSEIVEAYEILIDSSKRAEYDEYLSQMRSGQTKKTDPKKEHAKQMYQWGLTSYKKGENERAKGYFKAAIQFDDTRALYKSFYGLLLIKTNENKMEGWTKLQNSMSEGMGEKVIVENFVEGALIMEKEEDALRILESAIKWFKGDKKIEELYKEVNKLVKKKNNPLLKLFRRK